MCIYVYVCVYVFMCMYVYMYVYMHHACTENINSTKAYKSDYSIYFFLLVSNSYIWQRIFFEIEELFFFKKDIFLIIVLKYTQYFTWNN